MRIGAIVPDTGELPGQYGLARMAVAAEEAGAESLWVSDHLLMVDAPTTDYPYAPDGRPTWSPAIDYYESLTACTVMAAVTESVRIGPAVLVLPQRNVLEVAKVAATIDRISEGRLVLGVGAGWYRHEFEALGYDYDTRGTRFDEMLAVLRDCWSGRPAEFHGDEVDVPPAVVLHPRPWRPEGPPLLVGGMTGPALRRAARLGDGWLGLTYVSAFDAGALADRLARVHALREGYGGAPLTTTLKLHSRPQELDRLPSVVAEVERLGFDEVMIEPPWADGIGAACDTIETVIDSVRARAAS